MPNPIAQRQCSNNRRIQAPPPCINLIFTENLIGDRREITLHFRPPTIQERGEMATTTMTFEVPDSLPVYHSELLLQCVAYISPSLISYNEQQGIYVNLMEELQDWAGRVMLDSRSWANANELEVQLNQLYTESHRCTLIL
jgi:hypothetical protein